MKNKMLYVGLDVHKDTIAVAVAEDGRGGEIRFHGVIAHSADAVCTFRGIRPVVPTTSGGLNRSIRPPLARRLEALSSRYQFAGVWSPDLASFFLNDWPSSSTR